jgi:membrane protein YdbS with pleckstrin-like domain
MTTADGDADHATEEATETPTAADAEALAGPMRSLDPRVRYVWVVQALVTATVLGGIVGGIGFALERVFWPGVAAFLLVAVVSVAFAVARYRIWRYQVRTDSLFLDRGVLTRTRTVVPYVRIQHVDSNRGPVERGAGLATVVVYTAGSRGADVTIPGLTPEDAEELQDRLKRLAIVAEGEDAV